MLSDDDAIGARKPPGCSLYCDATWQRLQTELGLSQRELEITQAIFDDLTEQHMASRLGISTHTVHSYVKRLFQKLRVCSRVEALCTVVAVERELAVQGT